MRSVTWVRSRCCTVCMPRKPIREPNRKLNDRKAKTAASTSTQRTVAGQSPVAMPRSIASPITTGTSASPTW
ncbi:hypothetical protein TSST111916_12180 [Tsukamurella strandjordii]